MLAKKPPKWHVNGLNNLELFLKSCLISETILSELNVLSLILPSLFFPERSNTAALERFIIQSERRLESAGGQSAEPRCSGAEGTRKWVR